jgi:hypothetical protein
MKCRSPRQQITENVWSLSDRMSRDLYIARASARDGAVPTLARDALILRAA